jgi:hypothetical protein
LNKKDATLDTQDSLPASGLKVCWFATSAVCLLMRPRAWSLNFEENETDASCDLHDWSVQ